VFLVYVMDQLATHAGFDHAICERNRIITVAIRAFVRTSVWLTTDVNLHEGAQELGLRRLWQKAQVVLADACDWRDADGREGRATDDADRFLAHQPPISLSLGQIFLGNVGVARVRCVFLAIRRQALRNAHTRTIELAHDPLLVLHGRADGR